MTAVAMISSSMLMLVNPHHYAKLCPMRTTITFDPDTQAAVEAFKRDAGVGVSAAVNALIRKALVAPESEPFVQTTANLGDMIDVSNVAEALEYLEGPQAR